MLTIERRAMTDQERKTIRNLIRADRNVFQWVLNLNVGFLSVLGMLAGACVGMIAERLFHVSVGRLAVWVGTIAGATLGLCVEWIKRRDLDRANLPYEQDLKQGQMEIVRYQAKAAVALEEFEDEGYGFFIDIGDSKLLFLQGQYLDEPVSEGKFPSRSFDLVRAPVSHVIFDITCAGEPFTASRTLKPLTGSAYRWLEDQHIFPGTLETLNEKLHSAAERRTAGR